MLVFSAIFILVLVEVHALNEEGEFVAGTFILTQKSLNEAPYRYAGVLRRALDKVETRKPPSRSDEENCDVRYRIEPSGLRNTIQIQQNTLGIHLRDNNTVVISARLYIEVHAKTWIWKGISFGLLGCLKMNSCNGMIVTYSGLVDMKVSFQVLWDSLRKKMNINIKPVDTRVDNVNVAGCKPPWYLWWFSKWQELLNEGVRDAFQEYANNYEHMATIPEEFSPYPNVFVHYKITDLKWSADYVMFKANATFSTLIDKRNVTFIPETIHQESLIPIDDWGTASPSDKNSHLLQGVRLSTEFLNSLMWLASVSNVTNYQGSARVLDSQINGTVSYTPPTIRVERDNLLTIKIHHGLMLAQCRPVATPHRDPAVLFKAEFSDLSGSGRIRLSSTEDRTGVRVSLDELDLSQMVTKPFEPKLPLPESFENEIMKNGIAQLQPVVNNYLTAKPLYLPDNIAPFAAAPVLYLHNTGNGTGYAELISYCTCENVGSNFALCDPRSHVCDGKTTTEVSFHTTTDKSLIDDIKHNIKDGFSGILNIANGIINKPEDRSVDAPDFSTVNFTEFFQKSKQNLSYVGFHLTFFEDDASCRLSDVGHSAKVYWIWHTQHCTPLFVSGQQTDEYYMFHNDGNRLNFGCRDKVCSDCQYNDLLIDKDAGDCLTVGNQQSYRTQPPHKWNNVEREDVIANVYFSTELCSFHDRYIEPQLLSSHVNLGLGSDECRKTNKGMFFRHEPGNGSVGRADWNCEEKCFKCVFRVRDVAFETCMEYQKNLWISFTESVIESQPEVESLLPLQKELLYTAVVGAVVLTFVLIGGVAYCVIKNKKDQRLKTPTKDACMGRMGKLAAELKRHFGFRLLTWRESDMKQIREDVIQNVLMLISGSLAIIFAFQWNSDNNPLLIFDTKIKSGFAISIDVLETNSVVKFVNTLNFWTFLVNVANGSVSFFIVLAWVWTRTGDRAMWIKLRLMSSISLLAGIFIVLAFVIFTTYFDDLVVLKRNAGFFVTDNDSMHRVTSQVLKLSLNGLSLTVISFTIVFLFHGVGGGLFCGTVMFRLLHLDTKRENMEILTTMLVILTIIQPFFCLHPVIIWSQDSNHNSTFLLLIIFIWFLPVGVHIGIKSMVTQGLQQRCIQSSLMSAALEDGNSGSKTEPSGVMAKVDSGLAELRRNRRQQKTKEEKCAAYRKRVVTIFDFGIQLFQLLLFIITFSIITHHIVNTELNYERQKLQNFVLPAITSVFFWTVSVSYFLLSMVLDESRKETKLVFKDQDLRQQRELLRNSLRRRLTHLDNRGRSYRGRSLQRPLAPPPAPPTKRATMASYGADDTFKSIKLDVLPRSRPARPAPPPPVLKPKPDLDSSIRSFTSLGGAESSSRDLAPVDGDLDTSSSSFTSEDIVMPTKGCWPRVKATYHYFMETTEYRDPQAHGWRIKFRRIFLTIGTVLFSYQTVYTVISTQNYSSKAEIQKILDYTGTNLTWPDSGSVLDDVFSLYNKMERAKSYIMIGSAFLFWTSIFMDAASHFTERLSWKGMFFTGSRVTNFFGSMAVFASVIVVGIPDYLEVSNLDDICPFCGYDFNRTVRQIAEFSIGLFFACLFTFQLIPILVTIVPALVRASVLILIHPSLQIDRNDVTSLRMDILQQVIQVASLLTFPITFISMAILQQYQKDVWVTMLIIAFWTFPSLVLVIGLYFTRRYKKYMILLWVYYLYNCVYVGLLAALLFYSLKFQRVVELLENLLQEPSFWSSSLAQIFLCNVVISDMLYMTVF